MKKYLLLVFLVIACTGENALIRVKDSDFCASVPKDSYSIICEVTEHFGTTPEAVRIITKLANLAGVDQWYTAEVADSFMEEAQKQAKAFESNGATWELFGSYILNQYDLLPPKAQAAIVITKDLFEFNPPEIANRPLSSYDWIRINGNFADQRQILAPFKKKE